MTAVVLYRTRAAMLASALLALNAPSTQAQATAGAYVEATTLDSRALSTTEIGTQRLFLLDAKGDGATDLLTLRPQERDAALQTWERRRVAAGEQLVVDAGGPLARGVLDVTALYVPGGLAGAGRDLAVLAREGAADTGTPTLDILRNRGPGSDPRFGASLARFSLPGAQRLHYFPSFPIRPGAFGYVPFPLVISSGDASLRVVVVGDDGSLTLQPDALLHPGGVADVQVFREPNTQKPAFISLGAQPARLWLRGDDGLYSSQPLTLPGLAPGDQVRRGLVLDFHLDERPDLVLALTDGRVLRWDGTGPVGPGQPMSFGAAQPMGTGLTVHDLVELGVPYRDGLGVSRRRSGVLVAAEPESRFYDTDPAVASLPFQPTPRSYSPARAADGEFGLPIAYLGRSAGGVLALEFSETAAPIPNPVGWTELAPLPVVGAASAVATVIGLTSDAAREGNGSVLISAVSNSSGSCGQISNEIALRAGERFYLRSQPLVINAALGESFQLCLEPGDGSTSVRAPILRPAYRVDNACADECVINCLNGAAPPVAAGKTGKRIVDPLGLTTLTRFREEVLARSAKGRDYTAIYREYSDDMYRAVVTAPYALADIAAARDAWLPAIAAWVEGDTSTPITREMLDTLDLVAQHFVTLGSDELAATVSDQYRRLDPDSLLDQTIGDLQSRFEQDVPTRQILRSGFEAVGPAR